MLLLPLPKNAYSFFLQKVYENYLNDQNLYIFIQKVIRRQSYKLNYFKSRKWQQGEDRVVGSTNTYNNMMMIIIMKFQFKNKSLRRENFFHNKTK